MFGGSFAGAGFCLNAFPFELLAAEDVGPVEAIRRSVELIRKRSTPRSTRREIEEAASLVCRVEKTRWPVSAAWMAYWAVSGSRTSPTMITSGSWRRM